MEGTSWGRMAIKLRSCVYSRCHPDWTISLKKSNKICISAPVNWLFIPTQAGDYIAIYLSWRILNSCLTRHISVSVNIWPLYNFQKTFDYKIVDPFSSFLAHGSKVSFYVRISTTRLFSCATANTCLQALALVKDNHYALNTVWLCICTLDSIQPHPIFFDIS